MKNPFFQKMNKDVQRNIDKDEKPMLTSFFSETVLKEISEKPTSDVLDAFPSLEKTDTFHTPAELDVIDQAVAQQRLSTSINIYSVCAQIERIDEKLEVIQKTFSGNEIMPQKMKPWMEKKDALIKSYIQEGGDMKVLQKELKVRARQRNRFQSFSR